MANPETRGRTLAREDADDPCGPSGTPLFLKLPPLPEKRLALLERLVAEAGCRLYEARDGRGNALVLGGLLDDLGLLRHLLLKDHDLRIARETIEEGLARHAAPDGLPRFTEETFKRTEVVEEPDVPAGTTLKVSRDFLFDAAHNLPRYNGKCERLHGHTFRIRVTVEAPLDGWSGMSFDFHDLKKVVKQRVVDVLDHSYVNEVIPNPSAEHIAIWAWQRLADLPLEEITVWETPTCSVTYTGPPGS